MFVLCRRFGQCVAAVISWFERKITGRNGGIDGARAAAAAAAAGEDECDRWTDGELRDPLGAAIDAKLLRSRESRNSTTLVFVNTLSETVRIYWLNYDGSPQRYKTLQPGQRHVQQTYVLL